MDDPTQYIAQKYELLVGKWAHRVGLTAPVEQAPSADISTEKAEMVSILAGAR